MQRLNFPEYQFKIKEEKGKAKIFDEARKKYVSLSPEEWVRQHVIQYLNKEKEIPLGLISVEAGLEVYKTFKRYDITVYNRKASPVLIVECKAPHIRLDREVVEQALRYNLSLKVDYIMLTNGMSHLFLKLDKSDSTWKQLREIPDYSMLCSSRESR
jgi:hypothetical protein